jgi:hypothetical protein
MTEIDDSTDDIALSAYIDGELPEAKARALQERLLKEPVLARRLEALRGADSDALRLYAAIDELPMPQAVLDLLGQGEQTPENSNVIAFPKRGIQQFFQMPVAIAASVALLAGFLVADLFRESSGPEIAGLYAGVVETNSTLHRFLEDGTSAQEQLLGNGQSAELLLTFQDRDGDYCRQLRIDGAGAPVQGVACRRGNNWQVEAVSIAGKRSPDGSYQQASGDTPAAIGAAIDGMIGALPPLDREEEKSIISSGWKNFED